MELFPSSTELLKIGPLSVTYYAFFIALGAALAYIICRKNTDRIGYPKEILNDLFMDCLLVGIVGARLWYCLFENFEHYYLNPINLLKIYEGGLAIHGGVLAGVLYSYFYCKRKGVSWFKLADQTVPAILIAQAIGRWGNYINKEAHGVVVDVSFFDGALSFLKEGMHIQGQYYFPTFFFESILNITGFIIIYFIVRKLVKRRGQLFFSYFIWYGMVRFFIEFYRTDALMIGNLMIAQIISISFIVLGILGFIGVFDRFIPAHKPSIIFDLDGTLIDTKPGIVKTYAMLFEKYGDINQFNEDLQDEVIGPSLQTMFPKLFPNQDTEALIAEYREYNQKIFEEENRLMDDAYYVLKLLKEQGFHVGVVSSKSHQTVYNNLAIYDLNQFVEDIIGRDDVSQEKPSPEGLNKILSKNRWYRDEAMYVGDSVGDIEAGKAANLYTVACLFNEKRVEKMLATKPNASIKNLKELISIINQEIHFTRDGR